MPNEKPSQVREIRASNAEAFEAFYHEVKEPLLRYAWALTRDESLIYDILQEAMIAFWERRTSLDPSKSMRGYLFRIVRNLAFKYNAKRDEVEVAGQDLPDKQLAPDKEIEHQEYKKLLNSWISHLPERQREVFELSRIELLTHREIAEVLEISPKTVNNHLVSTLKFLKEKTAAYGIKPTKL